MMKYHVEGVLELTRFRRGNSGGATGVVDVQVGDSVDDGVFKGDGYSNNAINLNVGISGGTDFNSWARWDNITIPQGATIDVAYITVQARGTGNDGAGVASNLYFEDADDPTAPVDKDDAYGRTKTTAFTAWDDEDFIVDVETNSPSIKDVVKEIVDRGGWASGQAMQLLWYDNTSGDPKFYDLHSYDGVAAKAVKLHVEWSS